MATAPECICRSTFLALCISALLLPGMAFAEMYGASLYGEAEYGGTYEPSTSISGSVATTDPTIEKLLQRVAELKALIASLKSSGATTTVSGYSFDVDLTVGATTDDVSKLQQFLNGQGFVVNPTAGAAGSRGYESAYFGDLTREALARFQFANGIAPAVGYFGPITRALINSLQ